jgi:hypothetical protein
MADPRKIPGKRRIDTCEGDPHLSGSPKIEAVIQDWIVDLNTEIDGLRREIDGLKKRKEEQERIEKSFWRADITPGHLSIGPRMLL